MEEKKHAEPQVQYNIDFISSLEWNMKSKQVGLKWFTASSGQAVASHRKYTGSTSAAALQNKSPERFTSSSERTARFSRRVVPPAAEASERMESWASGAGAAPWRDAPRRAASVGGPQQLSVQSEAAALQVQMRVTSVWGMFDSIYLFSKQWKNRTLYKRLKQANW